MRRNLVLALLLLVAGLSAGCKSGATVISGAMEETTTTSRVLVVKPLAAETRALVVRGYVIAPHASLAAADLSVANLRDVDLEGADLSEAILDTSCMAGTNLRAAILTGARMYRVSLVGADLTNASLSGANLAGADMVGASLRRADLSGADLDAANLINADLRGADLTGATLIGIYWDRTTKWPRGFEPPLSA